MSLLIPVWLLWAAQPAWPQASPDDCRPYHRNWTYLEERPAQGLAADPSQLRTMPGEPVELPHRLLLPNTALWYRNKIRCTDTCLLVLQADDGAQVWQDERRLLPDAAGQYTLTPAADSAILLVRVLNNAMAGGLRSVCLLDRDDGAMRRRARNDRNEAVHRRDRLRQAARSNQYRTECYRAASESTVTFTIWGDSQGGWDTFALLVRRMALAPMDFSIGLGDLTGDGSDPSEWERLFDCLQPLTDRNTPVFLLAGNHDYDGYTDDLKAEQYLRWARGGADSQPWFAWRAGPAAFIALDPNATFPLGFGKDQVAWLEEQFESPMWRQAHWRFLLVHQPPYGQGWPGYGGDECVRELVDRYAESQRIDFVCSGHIHDYERLRKTFGRQHTHLVVSGGAGGGLEPPASSPEPRMDKLLKQHHYLTFTVGQEEVVVEAFDSQGHTLDRWDVRRPE